MIVTKGKVEVIAGGERRLLGTGDVVLAEDTEGSGHSTTAIEGTVIAVVRV
jgi:quercetin dioxygenase-like cupin family protein